MRSVFPAVVVMAALVAVAAWVAATSRVPSEGVNAASPAPQVTTLRGFIVAVVVDYANGSRTEFFLDLGNGTQMPLDLSGAAIRLKDHFAVYVGNPQRPVYVTGTWQGSTFKASEVYD